MSNKLLFLSSVFTPDNVDFLKKNSIGAISNANDSFQWSLIDGLISNNHSVDLINVPNIGAFPSRFNKMMIKGSETLINNQVNCINLKFCNFLLLKHIDIYFRMRHKLKEIDLLKYDCLLIYDLYPPFLSVIKYIKMFNSNIKVVNVVPDIYGMTRDSHSILSKIYDKFNNKILIRNLQFVDGYVYLTEFMSEKMPIFCQEKKSTIVEGILHPDVASDTDQDIDLVKGKYILYSGSLDLRHGIINLIKAYIDANLLNCKLVICGDGEGKVQVLDLIKQHKNVVYLGQVSREVAIKIQRNAFLLTNPRTSSGVFTRYSFPSKIIEYFASGVPTLMYKLDGIPTEYYEHCFYLEKEDHNSLVEKLIEINHLSMEEMKLKGRNAKNFVTLHKNSKVQCNKILALIESL